MFSFERVFVLGNVVTMDSAIWINSLFDSDLAVSEPGRQQVLSLIVDLAVEARNSEVEVFTRFDPLLKLLLDLLLLDQPLDV